MIKLILILVYDINFYDLIKTFSKDMIKFITNEAIIIL